jgi:hypothetical protein
MSSQSLWNLAWGPDISGLGTYSFRNRVRSDMFGLGARHVQEMPLELG